MITDFLLDWFFVMVDWALVGLPDDPFPQGYDLGWITDMNYFLPIEEMFELFLLIFGFGGTFAGTSLIIWFVVGILRGGATKA